MRPIPPGICVLVCGGREYSDRQTVTLTLDTLHKSRFIERLIEGGATGADMLARDWARHNRVPNYSYPANWHLHGKKAGPIRNGVMLRMEHPDLVVAFPGGAGTADMVRQARDARVEVMEVGSASVPKAPAGAAGAPAPLRLRGRQR